MPGHKRQGLYGDWLDAAYAHDITEIDGFDDLQAPGSLIADIETGLAAFYGTCRAFLSVNGSTCGNLASISALVPCGGALLMDKGSHRSVMNACRIRELRPIYLERGTIDGSDLTACISLEETDRKLTEAERSGHRPGAVIITSPTYEGFIADVDSIADVVHSHGIPLIVDGAHGAHLPVSRKADVITVSLHKTLPAMTQVSAVLVNPGYADPDEIKRHINMYQTTSPSYVLMSSAERCLSIMKSRGTELKDRLMERLKRTYSLNGGLRNLCITGPEHVGSWGIYDFDRSKINIMDRSHALSGREIYDIYRSKYLLQPEKYTDMTCLMMTGIMDSDEGFERLIKATREIDADIRI